MDTLVIAIDIIIVLLTATAGYYMYKDFKVHKDQVELEMKVGGKSKSIKAAVIGIVLYFFDTLGIGSYAPLTACFKIFKVTRDRYIPGTLNVGSIGMQMVSGILFITGVQVESLTLVGVLGAATIGAYVGGGLVSKLDVNKMRIAMGVALCVVAVVMVAGVMGLLGFDGDARGLEGWKLIVIVLIALIMGALMTIGIGIYAPLLAAVTILGMSADVAYPLMMGSCALLIPAAAIRFCQESIKSERPMYDRKVCLILITTGWIGVVIGYLCLGMMSMDLLKILVTIVIIYTAITMFYQGIKKKADKVAEQEDAEMGV